MQGVNEELLAQYPEREGIETDNILYELLHPMVEYLPRARGD